MKRLVIYSCLTAGYDTPADPLVVAEGVDYVLFTDACVSSGVWQVRPFYEATSGFTKAMTVRWHKMNPHVLFPEHEYSLWVDANVLIASEGLYTRLNELMDAGCLWSGIQHPYRDDVYEEGAEVLRQNRESYARMMSVVRFLKQEKFPRHSGLLENNVILRRHNADEVLIADSVWWSIVSTMTYRDQMSLMYSLRSASIQPELIIPAGTSTRNHPFFRYVGEGHGKPYVKDRSLKGIASDGRIALQRLIYRLFISL